MLMIIKTMFRIEGNYYAQKIKQEMNNVNFSVTLKIPTDLEISSFDMNVILGNLLDNAMENVSGEAGQELQIEAVLEYIDLQPNRSPPMRRISNNPK